MRHALSRSVAFGVAGATAVVLAQIGLYIANPRTFNSPVEIVIIRHFEAALVAGFVLTCGALVGFAAVGNRLASTREALVLGALAGIPATLLANAVVGSLGISGVIGVSAFLAAVVAYLGGGGLRSEASRGAPPLGR